MKPARTGQPVSGLRHLWEAARTLVASRKPWRHEVRRRVAEGFDRALVGMETRECARLARVDESLFRDWRDPRAQEQHPAPQWALVAMPPERCDAALEEIRRLNRELHGQAPALRSREQVAMDAMQALEELAAVTNGAMRDDLRIDDQEARAIAPRAARGLRVLRMLLASLGQEGTEP